MKFYRMVIKTTGLLILLIQLIQCIRDIDIIDTEILKLVDFNDSPLSKSYVFDSYHHMTDLENYPEVCEEYGNENCARLWLDEINKVLIRNRNRLANVHFNYATDINEKTLAVKKKFQMASSKLGLTFKAKIKKFKWKSYKSIKMRKLFARLSVFMRSDNISISNKLINITNQMSLIYNHAKPCFNNKCLEPGESGIVRLFKNERDYDTLSGFWTAWRDESGAKIRDLFIERVKLEKLGALENGYDDIPSVNLYDDFEEKDFKETVMKLYDEILPFYKELHAYVRHCLANYYPGRFDRNGPIPAHILGNVWGQQWTNIFPIIQKCQGKISNVNYQKEADNALKDVPVKKMFQMSEEFYKSIGMLKMTNEFWERSMLKQPPNKIVDCHGSAHDFSNGIDFRIKMCTEQNLDEFTTIHHEMGHTQYQMAYKDLPVFYRGSANSGFHEAIGDTMALSVKTPAHLLKIGLISKIPTHDGFDIDYLMATALEKVVFLPYALTMDTFIWGVYNGSVPMSKLNKHWWDLRLKFQGLKPPVKRSEKDFDPGAKYHITFGVSYIRYFVSFLIQFQFYEAMCDISGHVGPLHRCDFYQSKEAGSKMLEMLKQGQSQHWRKTIKILTGQNSINSMSILNFFKPLHKWLKSTNRKLNIPVGW